MPPGAPRSSARPGGSRRRRPPARTRREPRARVRSRGGSARTSGGRWRSGAPSRGRRAGRPPARRHRRRSDRRRPPRASAIAHQALPALARELEREEQSVPGRGAPRRRTRRSGRRTIACRTRIAASPSRSGCGSSSRSASRGAARPRRSVVVVRGDRRLGAGDVGAREVDGVLGRLEQRHGPAEAVERRLRLRLLEREAAERPEQPDPRVAVGRLLRARASTSATTARARPRSPRSVSA